MNTVKKGTEFELKCFELLKKSIENLELGLVPSACKIFYKKKYYSKDREKDIEFDISIEVWMSNAPNYSLLYLIECKDYGKNIPVDDVEEFYTKITQVAGVNVKGVFMTNTQFMEGGYNFARSKKMMLIQVNDNITLNVILHKTQKNEEEKIENRIQIDLDLLKTDVVVKEIIFRKWKRKLDSEIIKSLLDFVKGQKTQTDLRIPILSSEQIREIVEQIIMGFDESVLKKGTHINQKDFSKYLEKVFELRISHKHSNSSDSEGRKILSECNLLTKEIVIDSSLLSSSRYSFVLAHEIGHFFLHNKLIISQGSYENFTDSEYNFKISKYDLSNPRQWIEWQANTFASNLVMPRDSFILHFILKQDQMGLRKGQPLYVDEQRCNQDDFHNMTEYLARYFATTKTSVIYRMESLGIIKFNYRTKSAGEIMKELFPNMFE